MMTLEGPINFLDISLRKIQFSSVNKTNYPDVNVTIIDKINHNFEKIISMKKIKIYNLQPPSRIKNTYLRLILKKIHQF